MVKAITPSATTITQRRLQRSTSVPAKGPITMPGKIATIVAVAKTVAEPVDAVSHQTKANCTRLLPSSENA